MKSRKFIAFAIAVVCTMGFVSCENKKNKDAKENTADIVQNVGENEVSELINPKEGSEEYELGSYRLTSNGTKLYWDDETIPTELMLALEKYFLNIQNEDFEGYKASLYPDYAERYGKYLEEQYSETIEGSDKYTLEDSFNMQCSNLKNNLIDGMLFESETDKEFTGDYKISRIRGERFTLTGEETEESRIDSFFEYLSSVFDTDYKEFVKKETDRFEGLTFFVIVEGEDGKEHKIVNEMDIIFAVKDGKYYTFG